jgi:predicted Rossmann fold nucleotide-binding protein DprA/Smf involved in DNA uptake
VPLGPAASALLDRLRDGARTADELVRLAAVDPAQGSAALIELELAGKIALEDGVYRATI